MIQTVEQAASDATNIFKVDDNYDDHAYAEGHYKGFLRGAAWQKEQGIEWINVKEKLPPVGDWVLVWLEGGGAFKGCLKWENNSLTKKEWVAMFLDGEHKCTTRRVTHYAYINPPKTDK